MFNFIFNIYISLKLPNILLNNGIIKIADLGFAKELNHKNALTKSMLGSIKTMAPEIREGKPYGLNSVY